MQEKNASPVAHFRPSVPVFFIRTLLLGSWVPGFQIHIFREHGSSIPDSEIN
jgi:hypothetical protein